MTLYLPKYGLFDSTYMTKLHDIVSEWYRSEPIEEVPCINLLIEGDGQKHSLYLYKLVEEYLEQVIVPQKVHEQYRELLLQDIMLSLDEYGMSYHFITDGFQAQYEFKNMNLREVVL